ncbi:50S ribosomal protein L24 [Acidithiobacillus acidisediminis]|jgi:large subunit ribosomal protein L24|uniref:50S ribosomal protein L24 n=1 Tax=Acidithiobacillus acidisediminis TaxID=2937799 RepID=UPI00200E57D0|nr:50S ribosomal protein L24 [Acidithiobacillus sp. S30A2]
MSKIRKDDEVVVLAGKDKGKRGKVLRVLPEENRAIVEKVNMIKRHQRPDRMGNGGGIVEKEAPIHLSNLAVYNPTTGKADRVGYTFLEDGSKVRVFKGNGEHLAKH